MTFRINEDVRGDMLRALLARLNAATTPGKLLLYGGTQPSVGGAATTDELKATVILADPAGTVSGAVLTFTPGAEGLRTALGVIGWGRFVDGDGNYVADGSVLLVGDPGTADIRITNTEGLVGSFVRLGSGVIGL